MSAVPPPQGLNEVDYETIEAAVTETVRGRWFLSEFARRNRAGEMRQLLEAVGRVEASVTANQTALPSADPSIRLLIQRIKEVAGHLDGLAHDMREAGIDERFTESVGLQARAVAGMMRGGPAALPPKAAASDRADAPRPAGRLPRADLPPALAGMPAVTPSSRAAGEPTRADAKDADADDPRLATLSGLDRLTLAEKLALFS